MIEAIHSAIQKHSEDLVSLRHDLHQHPELAYQEKRTSARLTEILQTLPGVEVKTGIAGTGIMATLNAGKEGRAVTLRADMDALPIQEKNDVPYRSVHEGKMHACGHDGHMTALIGAAKVLSDLKDQFQGCVRFVFQPAEESGAGGQKMVEEGVLQNPPMEAAFAMHGWPDAEEGKVIVGAGAILAAATEFTIELKGKGAHAAYPHQGRDVVMAAAYLITRMQTVVSRLSDPAEPVVVSVCSIHAGDAHNVIPGECTLKGTLRGLRQEAHDAAMAQLQAMIPADAACAGIEGSIEFKDGYPSLVNDARAAALVRHVANDWVGESNVIADPPPSLGGEDFAFFANKVPAAMWRIGLKPNGASHAPRLHQPDFNFPDQVIPKAVEMHCRVALKFLEQGL
ncbi:MAG: M20 metallopeptidase family protein [Phycisphaerae bacterium]